MNPLEEYIAVSKHLDAIVNHLKELVPKSISVQLHGGRFNQDDIKNVSINGTTLFVSLLRLNFTGAKAHFDASESQSIADLKRDIYADMSIGISIASRDQAGIAQRHVIAVRVANFLGVALIGQNFGSDKCSNIASVDARNLFSASVDKQKNVNFWAAAFDQKIEFPAEVKPSKLPDRIFVGFDPEIGLDHKDDYVEVTK